MERAILSLCAIAATAAPVWLACHLLAALPLMVQP